MNKKTKFTLGVFICFVGLSIFFYKSKENPRVYLNNRVNLAYINESIDTDNFNEVIQLIEKSDIPVDDKIKKILKHLKGLYIISDSNFVSRKKNPVGILNFGYLYPIFSFEITKYFDKREEFYELKKEYSDKYLKGTSLFLREERGNFLIARRIKDIEEILRNEKYINSDFVKILNRDSKNNLGIVVVNLGKNPLGGFNELVLTGDVKKKDIIFKSIIGGENDIIKSFNKITDDGLSGERTLKRNRLYLRTSRENELRSFFFFLNYFFRNSLLDDIFSKVYINSSKNLIGHIGKDFEKTTIEDNQFLYGDIDVKIPKIDSMAKLKLVGIANENRLTIKGTTNKSVVIKMLKEIK